MIRAGSHGMLWVAGDPVARCTRWTLDIERATSEITPIYRWAERSIPLKRSASGTILLAYDPDDVGTAAAISSFRSNEPPEIELSLRADKNISIGYNCFAHISSVETVVATRDAHRLQIGFTITGPITQV